MDNVKNMPESLDSCIDKDYIGYVRELLLLTEITILKLESKNDSSIFYKIPIHLADYAKLIEFRDKLVKCNSTIDKKFFGEEYVQRIETVEATPTRYVTKSPYSIIKEIDEEYMGHLTRVSTCPEEKNNFVPFKD